MDQNALLELRKIGLTDGELKVYGALLGLGESTKTSLVKAAGVTAANLYDIANRLAEKGIISIVERNGVKHFAPANPERLRDFIAKKKAELDGEARIIEQIIPALRASYKDIQPLLRIESYTGWDGLATIFNDLLDECTAKDTNYVYGASVGDRPDHADAFFLKYSKMRARKRIPLKIIFTEDVKQRKDRIAWFMNERTCEVRFLTQHATTEMMIYKDTALILILTASPLAIRIRDASVAASFKEQFNALWRLAKR